MNSLGEIKVEDTLKEELKSEKFIVTADVIPPKGTEYYKCLKGIELLKGDWDMLSTSCST